MIDRQEIAFTEEQLAQLTATVTPNTVLVGGQARAFWVDRYNIDQAWDTAAAHCAPGAWLRVTTGCAASS